MAGKKLTVKKNKLGSKSSWVFEVVSGILKSKPVQVCKNKFQQFQYLLLHFTWGCRRLKELKLGKVSQNFHWSRCNAKNNATVLSYCEGCLQYLQVLNPWEEQRKNFKVMSFTCLHTFELLNKYLCCMYMLCSCIKLNSIEVWCELNVCFLLWLLFMSPDMPLWLVAVPISNLVLAVKIQETET